MTTLDAAEMMPELGCDVCHEEPAVGVAAVPCVPISVAYGRRCLNANAHPWWVLVANTAACGGLEHTHDGWREMVLATCNHLGRSLEEFTAAVTADLETFEGEQ